MKKIILFLILAAGWSSCTKEESLGVGYPPLVGTWKLVKKSGLKDSVYTVKVSSYVLKDSSYTVNDSVYTVKVRSYVEKDSSYTVIDVPYVKTIADPDLQTLTFASDGTVSSLGEETSYYRSSKYYKVDSVRFVGQRVGFIVGSIYPAFYQNLSLKSDSLRLSPCPDQLCDLVFVKGR